MGLSKLKTFNTIITTIASSDGAQLGTTVYQAPEILLDRQSANTKMDVWSLACTLVPTCNGMEIVDIDTSQKVHRFSSRRI